MTLASSMVVSAEEEHAWRDPFYRDVITEWGASALQSTGYFDDGATREDLQEAILDPFFCTPVHKLTRSPGRTKPLVLLATGAFSPIHQGHVDMLLSARRALESNGEHVAGAYLSPSHDHYVSVKLSHEAVPADERLTLVHEKISRHDWIMACPWESKWVANPINFTTVLLRLQNHLRTSWDDECEVVLVVGADNSEFARCFVRHGRCVIVARGGCESRLAEVFDDPRMASAIHEKRVLAAPAFPRSIFMSSTKVRTAAAATPAAAESVSGGRGGGVPPQATRRYAVRDDLEWATRRWRASVPRRVLEPALAEFKYSALKSIQAGLLGVGGPRVTVDLLNHEKQREVARELCAGNVVVSLDTSTPATHRLGISRVFHPFDVQLHSHGIVARPGWPSPQEQVEAIAAKSVVLMDDDIWTGATIDYASALLEGADIEISRTVSLMSAIEPEKHRPMDLIDLRDLLVGADDSGLVVQDSGGLVTRAPYLPPFVDLGSRASIPPAEVRGLAYRLWSANATFFAKTGLRVGDACAAVRQFLHSLGHPDGELLSEVCDRYRRRMVELPFAAGSDVHRMLRNPLS
ncbi:hypothetical protein [Streptomyces sp. RerS4]|uniref:hypothetical protein n=1 Tax=Streptomyces sp. RerS4 TaxID=2942449 RepID=UPI00201C09F2|nr:hypothetical protein [Streptomyces sp. RerS4]UQW99272.1 hypothetical protein M4D82_01030 [Streptomyces sp. RerS4]